MSFAMIRMPGQDGRSPVNLLQKHDSHKLVRPGRGSECGHEVGAAPQGLADAVSAPDRKTKRPACAVAPAAQPNRQAIAAEIFAAAVKHDGDGAVRHNGRESDRFFDDAALRLASAALPDLD